MDAVTHRRNIAGIGEQLVLEFSDAMPPGQILRIVHRANRLVIHTTADDQDAVSLCESIARRLICDRLSEVIRHSASA